MKSIKSSLLISLIGIFVLIVIYPFSSTMAGILAKPLVEVTEKASTYLPLILNGEPKKLIFVAGPIQAEIDNEDIYMINTNGDELVNLTNSPSGYFDLTWSPDGSRFAFFKQYEGLFTMNADGSGQAYLANGVEPSWSPDSSRIVFVNDSRLSIINLDGTGLRDLVRIKDGIIGTPDWSPSGNKIVYYWNDILGHTDIFVVNLDGSEITNLTNGLGGVNPQWSPDGSQILFGESGDIFVMNADGTQRTNISNSLEYHTAYVWSPDRNKIAFDCNSGQICVMNPDGSGKTNVSGENSAYSWPTWAQDGSLLAFLEGSFASNYNIFIVDTDGNGKTFVTNLPDDTWKKELIWQP